MQCLSVQHTGCTPVFMQIVLMFASYCFTTSLLTVAACALTCMNGGTLNETTCTCDCADGYSGDNCESECISGSEPKAARHSIDSVSWLVPGETSYALYIVVNIMTVIMVDVMIAAPLPR